MDDDAWDQQARDETPQERLDRNWSELLQELRVVQTGVQLLTGFLLTLPFQQKFDQVSGFERGLYLIAVSASVLATGFLQAPVSLHRALFRRHQRRVSVLAAHRLAVVGLALLAVAVISVTMLVFGFVQGRSVSVVAGVVVTAVLSLLWLVLPLSLRRSRS